MPLLMRKAYRYREQSRLRISPLELTSEGPSLRKELPQSLSSGLVMHLKVSRMRLRSCSMWAMSAELNFIFLRERQRCTSQSAITSSWSFSMRQKIQKQSELFFIIFQSQRQTLGHSLWQSQRRLPLPPPSWIENSTPSPLDNMSTLPPCSTLQDSLKTISRPSYSRLKVNSSVSCCLLGCVFCSSTCITLLRFSQATCWRIQWRRRASRLSLARSIFSQYLWSYTSMSCLNKARRASTVIGLKCADFCRTSSRDISMERNSESEPSIYRTYARRSPGRMLLRRVSFSRLRLFSKFLRDWQMTLMFSGGCSFFSTSVCLRMKLSLIMVLCSFFCFSVCLPTFFERLYSLFISSREARSKFSARLQWIEDRLFRFRLDLFELLLFYSCSTMLSRRRSIFFSLSASIITSWIRLFSYGPLYRYSPNRPGESCTRCSFLRASLALGSISIKAELVTSLTNLGSFSIRGCSSFSQSSSPSSRLQTAWHQNSLILQAGAELSRSSKVTPLNNSLTSAPQCCLSKSLNYQSLRWNICLGRRPISLSYRSSSYLALRSTASLCSTLPSSGRALSRMKTVSSLRWPCSSDLHSASSLCRLLMQILSRSTSTPPSLIRARQQAEWNCELRRLLLEDSNCLLKVVQYSPASCWIYLLRISSTPLNRTSTSSTCLILQSQTKQWLWRCLSITPWMRQNCGFWLCSSAQQAMHSLLSRMCSRCLLIPAVSFASTQLRYLPQRAESRSCRYSLRSGLQSNTRSSVRRSTLSSLQMWAQQLSNSSVSFCAILFSLEQDIFDYQLQGGQAGLCQIKPGYKLMNKLREEETLKSISGLISRLLKEQQENQPPKRASPAKEPPRRSPVRQSLQIVESLYERKRRRDQKVEEMRRSIEESEIIKPFRVTNLISNCINELNPKDRIDLRTSKILQDREKKLLLTRLVKEVPAFQNKNLQNTRKSLDPDWYDAKVQRELWHRDRRLEESRLMKASEILKQVKEKPAINKVSNQYFREYARKYDLEQKSFVERQSSLHELSKRCKKRVKQQLHQAESPFRPNLKRTKSRQKSAVVVRTEGNITFGARAKPLKSYLNNSQLHSQYEQASTRQARLSPHSQFYFK